MTNGNPDTAAMARGGEPLPSNDIAGLARRVREIDPSRYLDEQARLAYHDALDRWPLLAKLMGLAD
ncbi:hypothetical protein BTI_4055 [Burkholderia thailandensis MSMB121]|uniref:Uncharacterized protein n=2 Tax=Burkholderia humptydooensis TaxID=430531 RepID=A0A7U4P995_9BURK|nr:MULTISPECIES: hypothetical protein [Burkholderia]AGK51192.1 hypothetical protein BTI_4055 [Burkholderia thailandensis MSMB121]ATF32364.1 hypothetical protein CO709_02335 [Burkholderia thailandensis]AJY38581.1 hypothetical protein BW21_6063 [Burkholderia sp. 2002721687]ALX45330.1 hypothetical protein AQ610_22900 [Burkholderia humptydooensis]EIP85483.1 hypothetical protein A33K_18038 [Burkholderia humptydooensis MSMB43]